MLEDNIRRLSKEKDYIKDKNDSLNFLFEPKGINDAISSIRVSIKTKNILKKHLKPRESYEELILRIIETNERLKEETKYFREIEKKNKNLIKYIESNFKRIKKTLTYHPDLKIEYSYNESKIKFYENFSFNLEIDNFILQGKPISEQDAIKIIQTIDIIRSLKKIDLDSDVKDIIKRKELLLESEKESIKTKYLIYFKILVFIINKKMDKRINESNILNLDFWEELYDSKGLHSNSLQEDVIQKLKKFKLEAEQIKINYQRRLWHMK
ncbi:MAG: hypothetical protein U9R34_06170 [Nanoarchaeota archaeon]|nr:hypothetical protein [Nanoarchaeota archaeon]